MNRLQRTAIALASTLVLASGSVLAIGDIQVSNNGGRVIHPYFKSNCWNPELIGAGPGEWVFFGGIGPDSSFNWDRFHVLLDPKCRNPLVKFTYALDGEDPPRETVVERTVVLHYDALANTTITLGNRVVVTGVVSTP